MLRKKIDLDLFAIFKNEPISKKYPVLFRLAHTFYQKIANKFNAN